MKSSQHVREQNSGFTMIELLMVIMLIAILGAVALPQFLDFRAEGRAAAALALETSLNMGIKLQKNQAMLKCSATTGVQVPFDSFAANDITAGASPLCTTTQIPDESQRRILSQVGFPPNPYNGLNTVGDCSGSTYVGYCYDATNGIASVPTTTSP